MAVGKDGTGEAEAETEVENEDTDGETMGREGIAIKIHRGQDLEIGSSETVQGTMIAGCITIGLTNADVSEVSRLTVTDEGAIRGIETIMQGNESISNAMDRLVGFLHQATPC